MFSLPSRLPSAPAFSDAPLHHACRCASATDRAKTKHDGGQSRNARSAVCLSLHESRRPRNFARHPCAATQRIAQFFLLLLFLLAACRKTPKQVTKHARTEYPFRIPALTRSHSATPSRKLHTQTTTPAIHHRVTKSPHHSNPETRRHPTPEKIRAQYPPTYRATIKHRHKPRRWKCNTTCSYYSTRQRSRVMKQRKEEVEEETEISSRKNNSAASAAGERRGRAVHVGQAGHDRRGRTGKSVPTGRTDLPSAG